MGKKSVLLSVVAITAIISGCATQETSPAPAPSATNEFRCYEDMPCFFPEMRVSEAEDIALCEAGYQGYADPTTGYEPLGPCLDEVEEYWADKG